MPPEGELTPEVLLRLVSSFAGEPGSADRGAAWVDGVQQTVAALELPGRPPTLCPGCGHRAAFYAIKKALPKTVTEVAEIEGPGSSDSEDAPDGEYSNPSDSDS